MTEEAVNNRQNNDGQRPSSRSWVLVALFWTYVSIPLAWGVYETLGGIAGIFSAG